jgi:hypothetical protein
MRKTRRGIPGDSSGRPPIPPGISGGRFFRKRPRVFRPKKPRPQTVQSPPIPGQLPPTTAEHQSNIRQTLAKHPSNIRQTPAGHSKRSSGTRRRPRSFGRETSRPVARTAGRAGRIFRTKRDRDARIGTAPGSVRARRIFAGRPGEFRKGPGFLRNFNVSARISFAP